MNELFYIIRDNLVGTHYFIYCFTLIFFMFSIIGYLFKEKYAKFNIKLANSNELELEKDDGKIKLGQKEKKVREHAKVPRSMGKTTTINVTSTTSINTTSSMGDVIISKKENLPGDVQIQENQHVSSNPTPIPNPELTPKPNPQPMPNAENGVLKPSTLSAENQVNLSTDVPKI